MDYTVEHILVARDQLLERGSLSSCDEWVQRVLTRHMASMVALSDGWGDDELEWSHCSAWGDGDGLGRRWGDPGGELYCDGDECGGGNGEGDGYGDDYWNGSHGDGPRPWSLGPKE